MINKVIAKPFEIDHYTLSLYAEAHRRYTKLLNEREDFIHSLYEDISPRLTAMDCETGLAYTMGANTEMSALLIIEHKAAYETLINKEKMKAKAFQSGLGTLSRLEQEIIKIHYQGTENKLGLSVMKHKDVLRTAKIKLCAFLESAKVKALEDRRKREKQAIRERIHAI